MAHLFVPGIECLCDPIEEQRLAASHVDTGPSASLVLMRLKGRILAANADGMTIGFGNREIDIDRMEYAGELGAYDVKGDVILLDQSSPLVSLDRCWGSSPRRTMSRLFEKIEKPSAKALAGMAPSRMFWLHISDQIMAGQFVGGL